jgi:hypothetical protein
MLQVLVGKLAVSGGKTSAAHDEEQHASQAVKLAASAETTAGQAADLASLQAQLEAVMKAAGHHVSQ